MLGQNSNRTPRLTESQIAFIFQQAGEGTPLSEICAALGLSDAAYLRWRRQFGGLLPSEYISVQELEAQVRRLKRELADLLDLREDPTRIPDPLRRSRSGAGLEQIRKEAKPANDQVPQISCHLHRSMSTQRVAFRKTRRGIVAFRKSSQTRRRIANSLKHNEISKG